MTLKRNTQLSYATLHETHNLLTEIKKAFHWRHYFAALLKKERYPKPRGDYRGKS